MVIVFSSSTGLNLFSRKNLLYGVLLIMSENLKLQPIQNWLKKNNWFFYDHQLETLNQSINGHDILLIAPTIKVFLYFKEYSFNKNFVLKLSDPSIIKS